MMTIDFDPHTEDWAGDTHIWGERPRLVSVTQPIAPVALTDFLSLMDGQARIYWKNDLGLVAYAGAGAAAVISADGTSRVARIQLQIDHLFEEAIIAASGAPKVALPRLFGGFAFRADHSAEDVWSAFPAASFVLPRYQIAQVAGVTWLTVSHYAEADEFAAAGGTPLNTVRADAAALVARLKTLELPARRHARARQVCYPLPQDVWRDQVNSARGRIHAGELKKVVLARTGDVDFDAAPDIVSALEKLDHRYPDCYRFLIEPEPGKAFFGATPELLAEIHEATLHTAALAGSRRRGLTPAEDDALAADLLADPKERGEHAVVVEMVRERVQPYARALYIPSEPTVFRLKNIQHLYTPVRADLETHFDALDLVGELHPTPALGGYPQRAAMLAIREIETFERGWYAAPVGWIDASGDGQFAVAIRSAVADGARVRLYAGAGIVSESDPDKEWAETGIKFKPMLDALGVEHGVS